VEFVVDIPAARSVVPPHALFLDPAVMDFTMDSDGLYQSVHPTDHLVLMALGVAQGSVVVVPELGATIRDIRISSRVLMTADAEQRVRAALSNLISANDIELVSVDCYASAANRVYLEVKWRNLRAPDEDQNRSVTLS
jgi:hypothetical protein